MNASEWRAVAGLSMLQALRMLGMFMILPVFALYARKLAGVDSGLQMGLALGIYGLTQAALQIPMGAWSDRIGRKPIIIGGLVMFIIGSLVAGFAHSLPMITLGRALQGAGAISAAVSALLADVTRTSVRTQAMALMGAGMGISFIIALIIGPVLDGVIGVPGIFLLTAVGGALAIPLVIFGLPSVPPQKVARVPISKVLANRRLLKLDAGIMMLHASMTAMFIGVPLALEQTLGMPSTAHWKVYLPVMVLSLVPVFPLIRWGEKSGNTRAIFTGAVVLLAVALLLAAEAHGTGWAVIATVAIFFIGFNFLEGSLPSMISREAPAAQKGTALGVYSTCQFLGGFLGASIGGAALQHFGVGGVFAAAAALPLIWLCLAIPSAPTVHAPEETQRT